MALFRQGLGSALVDNSSVEPFGRQISGEGKYRRALETKEHAGNVTVGELCQPPERSGGGFPGLAYFFRWAEKISAADGRRWGQRWTHEFSIVVRTTIIRRRKEVPVRQQAPGEVDAKGVRDAPESCVWFPAGGSLPRCRVGLRINGRLKRQRRTHVS